MKKANNKHGFTMVELLAAIVIMGILSTIGVVSIVNIRKAQEEKHNRHQIEVFKQTAKTYFTDNKSKLPIEPMGTKTVSLQELIDENYIDSLLKYNKEDYDLNSYVTVQFIGNGRYTYISSLKDEGREIIDSDPNEVNITYDFTIPNQFINEYEDEEDNHYTNKNSKIGIEINDKDGIAAYQYTITGNKIKKESEYIYVVSGESTIKDSIILNTKDYPDGIYKLTFTVWDINGYKKVYKGKKYDNDKVDKIILDTKKPECDIDANTIDDDKNEAKYLSNTWTNKTVNLKATCFDNNGSGCTLRQEEINYWETDTYTYSRDFEDKAGNKVSCEPYKIKIDKIYPECNVTGGSETWINKGSTTQSRTITAKCTDKGGSGCNPKTESFYHEYKDDIETTTAGAKGNNNGGTVSDNAGNTTTCDAEQIVKIDKTPPDCNVSGGSDEWINKASPIQYRRITAKCDDNGGSGCTGLATFSQDYSGNMNISTAGAMANEEGGTVQDMAGNSTSCAADQVVKIDVNEPTCKSTGGSTSWINASSNPASITLVGECTDTGPSGCAGNVQRTITTYTNSSSESPGTVYDNAGNPGACSANQTVKIDVTPPICTVTGGSATWRNNSSETKTRKITATCSDAESGCVTESFSKTYSGDTNTTSAGAVGIGNGGSVSDAAGNTTSCAADRTVKIDLTAPTCGSFSVTSGTKRWSDWYITNVTAAVGCTDATSSCTANTFSKTFKGEGNKSRTITISDNAGNTTDCKKTYKIDKTNPTMTTSFITNGTNSQCNSTTENYIAITYNDAISGITSRPEVSWSFTKSDGNGYSNAQGKNDDYENNSQDIICVPKNSSGHSATTIFCDAAGRCMKCTYPSNQCEEFE